MAVPTELWIASGSAPFTKWTNAAKLRRTYDADVRGYVVELPPVTAGTPKPSLSGACGVWLRALAQASIHSHTSPFCLPRPFSGAATPGASAAALRACGDVGVTGAHVRGGRSSGSLPLAPLLTLRCSVTDAGGVRRRLAVSTAFTEAKVTALHAQVPLPLPRDTWCTLALCVADLLAAFFGGVALRCTETLTLGASSAAELQVGGPPLLRLTCLRSSPPACSHGAQAAPHLGAHRNTA